MGPSKMSNLMNLNVRLAELSRRLSNARANNADEDTISKLEDDIAEIEYQIEQIEDNEYDDRHGADWR